jgi:hypothetical protein
MTSLDAMLDEVDDAAAQLRRQHRATTLMETFPQGIRLADTAARLVDLETGEILTLRAEVPASDPQGRSSTLTLRVAGTYSASRASAPSVPDVSARVLTRSYRRADAAAVVRPAARRRYCDLVDIRRSDRWHRRREVGADACIG